MAINGTTQRSIRLVFRFIILYFQQPPSCNIMGGEDSIMKQKRIGCVVGLLVILMASNFAAALPGQDEIDKCAATWTTRDQWEAREDAARKGPGPARALAAEHGA